MNTNNPSSYIKRGSEYNVITQCADYILKQLIYAFCIRFFSYLICTLSWHLYFCHPVPISSSSHSKPSGKGLGRNSFCLLLNTIVIFELKCKWNIALLWNSAFSNLFWVILNSNLSENKQKSCYVNFCIHLFICYNSRKKVREQNWYK